MSKQIKDNYELRNVCRSAGLSFIGSFMGEFLDKREMWSNPDTKAQVVAYMQSRLNNKQYFLFTFSSKKMQLYLEKCP